MYTQAQIEEALDWRDHYGVVIAFDDLITQTATRTNRLYSTLTRIERVPIHVNLFDSQVTNGGFYQFFFHSSGNYAVDILKTLETINADTYVILLDDALSLFPNPYPVEESKRTQILKNFSIDSLQQLKRLSQLYFELPDIPFTQAALFLRANWKTLLEI
jgi:hypothetical protein